MNQRKATDLALQVYEAVGRLEETAMFAMGEAIRTKDEFAEHVFDAIIELSRAALSAFTTLDVEDDDVVVEPDEL